MAMKKASSQVGSEYKDFTGTDMSEQQEREGEAGNKRQVNLEAVYSHPGDSNIGSIDNHSGSSHAPTNYLYAGHPNHFNSATTYQPYNNSNAYPTTVHQPVPPFSAMYSYSQTNAIATVPGIVSNEYMRLPTFASQPLGSSQSNHGMFCLPNQDGRISNCNEGSANPGINSGHVSQSASLLNNLSNPHQELSSSGFH